MITDDEIQALLDDVYRYRTLVPGSGNDVEYIARLAQSGDADARAACVRIRDNKLSRGAA